MQKLLSEHIWILAGKNIVSHLGYGSVHVTAITVPVYAQFVLSGRADYRK